MSNLKDISFLTLRQQINLIKNKTVSSVELCTFYLEQIHRLNKKYNCFITINDTDSLQKAKLIDQNINKKDLSKEALLGIPISVKDVIHTKNIRTTFGSIIHKNFIPKSDSVSVERIKNHGGIILGKSNTPEFAFGAVCENNLLGSTLNPWDSTRSSGGSSGGSAAAVTLGLSPVSLGTDFGGSVRTPAAFCGCVGLRPTPGRIPNKDKYNAWKWLSTEGILARNAKDAFYLLQTISGHHPLDPFSQYESWPQTKGNIRFAYTLDFGGAYQVDPEIKALWNKTINILKKNISNLSKAYPDVSDADKSFKTLRSFNAWMNYQELINTYKTKLSKSFIWNVEQGKKISAKEVKVAEQAQHRIFINFINFFKDYDILIVPSTSVLPFTNSQKNVNQINGVKTTSIIDYLACTYFISLVGLPSISIPSPVKYGNLPFGIQLIAKPYHEHLITKVAHQLEKSGFIFNKPEVVNYT